MIYKVGNILEHMDDADVILVTTNSYINRNRQLVMGRGFASCMASKFPEIKEIAGERIGHLSRYGVINIPKIICSVNASRIDIALFQVKYHFKDNADLDLVKFSTMMLRIWAYIEKDKEFFLNYPGIGQGKLDKSLVEPIVSKLPDNVTIWEVK